MSDAFEHLLDRLVPGAGRQAAADPSAPDFPLDLGLEPLELLARGGTGWIFRARDPVLEREVVVKIARPDQGVAAQDAVVAEARRAAALAHPSVLPVHRVVVRGGLVCAEYPLAPTATLESLLADPQALARRDLPGRLALLRSPVRALARAHARGLVHGDVHPGNIVLGEDEAVYLLDWAGPPARTAAPTFSGSPGHAAPEVLHGAPPGPAADVYALGAVAWELCAGRPLRPRQRGEELGAYLARWRSRPAPALPPELPAPPGTAALLADALAADPARRPDAEALAARLDAVLSGEADRAGQRARAQALLGEAREILSRYGDLGHRRDDERRVVAIQRARVPAHAPPAAKRALWEAEERLEQVELERGLTWLDAVHRATLASALDTETTEAREIVAELWWVRMEDMASRGLAREEALAAHEVAVFDPERRGAVLRAPCRLSLEVEGGGPATVELARLVARRRRLEPQPSVTLPLPLARHELAPGRWQLTVRATGAAPAVCPLSVSRGEHASLRVRLYDAAQVGEGWALVPGGGFLLGGDPQALQPLPRCRPTLGDLFVRRTCVTSAEWLDFLAALPREEARQRAPASTSPTGGRCPWWSEGPQGWALPPGWDPRWPVVGVDASDAAAYAAWISGRTGHPQRLPTEEEWEKAARGTDGRAFPWGDGFDPTFAHMRSARAEGPGLAAVDAFPGDRSPYGCLGMAGGVREWTASWMEHDLVVVRGGSWADEEPALRCASRTGLPPGWRADNLGFRLVSEVPQG